MVASSPGLVVALALAMSTVTLPAGLAGQATDDPLAGAPTREEQETMAEILALQVQIGRLLRTLPPELQDAVLERLEAMSAGEALPAEGDRPVLTESGVGSIEPLMPPEAVARAEAEEEGVAGELSADGEVPVVPAIPTRDRLKAPPADCNTLALFDSNEDGVVSARDRYWRHLYLWSDADGDGVMQDTEVQSAYERGVRSLDVRLDTFLRKAGDQSVPSEIEVDRYIVLDVSGDGFDSTERLLDDGVLLVDAGKLGRGDGPDLLDETGLPLDGLQAFRRGLRLVALSGESETLTCP